MAKKKSGLFMAVLGLVLTGFLAFTQKSMAEPLVIERQNNGIITVEVEVADTPEMRSKGLMFRKTMPEMSGMLFKFDQERMIAMWMKNTFIPLDMLFVGSNGIVHNIKRGAQPQDLTVIESGAPTKWVLELNAGFVDKYNIRTGDRLRVPAD